MTDAVLINVLNMYKNKFLQITLARDMPIAALINGFSGTWKFKANDTRTVLNEIIDSNCFKAR